MAIDVSWMGTTRELASARAQAELWIAEAGATGDPDKIRRYQTERVKASKVDDPRGPRFRYLAEVHMIVLLEEAEDAQRISGIPV